MRAKSVQKSIVLFSIAMMACAGKSSESSNNAIENYEGIEFEMPTIQEPVIPDYTVSITDFGAISGGQVLNTQAFEDAIGAVTENGGGRIMIPAGIWLTGPIILKSNLELHAESGALIIFSTDKDLYPLVETSFEGLNTWRCISPIYGKELENIAFTGSGVWDGSGDAWRMVKRSKITTSQWNKLVASGGYVNKRGDQWYPSEQFKKAMETSDMNVPTHLTKKEEFEAIRDFLRPVMVSIQNSKQVMFDGPVFQNSPAWCIHPLMVENLIVRNLTVRNPWYSQNGDGIDVESCKNVLLENCNFDVGDDAICIKSGKDEEGRLRGVPCENLIIKNNIVYHGHGGVTVGSEMSGGVKNMHVSNCTFMGTDVGLRFKSNRGRGGVVENIFISNIIMTDIPTYAISFNLYYGGRSVSEEIDAKGGIENSVETVPVTEKTPSFRNISISDIEVRGALQAILLQGLPEMNVENVKLTNMLIEADKGISIADASNVEIDNIRLITKDNKAIDIFNSRDLEIKKFDYDFNSNNAISIKGEKCLNITINSEIKEYVSVGKKVKEGTVKF